MLQFLKSLMSLLPEVRRPARTPALKEKLLWTFVVLLIFYVMGHIYPLGIDIKQYAGLERLEILLGSKMGTLITAGIGPIVLASIFLQLAVGAKIISLDLSVPENKKLFQGLQKTLAIALSFFEAAVYVFTGYIPASSAAPLFGSLIFTQFLVMFQLAFGSIMLLYLDEVVQKYGIGSGISLFIAAGVAQTVFLGSVSLIGEAGDLLVKGNIRTSVFTLLPIVFTVLVFLVVVYLEGMKIELPLAYGRARGLGARYPIKFMYVSNIPVILASAVILNIQLMGMFFSNAGMPLLGKYEGNHPVQGTLAYYMTSLPSPLLLPGKYETYLGMIFSWDGLIHILVYGLVLVSLCVLFGWFWIESTGMGPGEVASQLERAGLQIPGFRQDPRVIEGILARYIPIITVLSSIAVGLLAWGADITGALGTGTGILLTVGILYRFYEDLAQQQIFEMYPVLKRFVK
ncbi:preprotein translocase subunit SecY [Candidatus Micrarchaeota archaeon]|nr:preprotein translocase subunit SecY [Candidatus Micrarchaeota archaeon]